MIDILKVGQDFIVLPNVTRFHLDRAGTGTVMFLFSSGDAYLLGDQWMRDAVGDWLQGKEASRTDVGHAVVIHDVTPKDAPEPKEWPKQGNIVQARPGPAPGGPGRLRIQ